VTELFAPVCSVTTTRRKRFLWAAWWSGPPARHPFRKPDAWAGGARTPEEAHAEAERVAGRPLIMAAPLWARAWGRIVNGEPPFFRPPRDPGAVGAHRPPGTGLRAPLDELGLAPGATVEAIKRAYRRRALETHPDRGGSDEAFRAVQRAYVAATARADGTKKRRRRRD
jgi:hypothetical protein